MPSFRATSPQHPFAPKVYLVISMPITASSALRPMETTKVVRLVTSPPFSFNAGHTTVTGVVFLSFFGAFLFNFLVAKGCWPHKEKHPELHDGVFFCYRVRPEV